jgi:hypothetical protein
MGMLDLAERLEGSEEFQNTLIGEAENIRDRYNTLWDVLHAEPVFPYADRLQIEGQIRRVHDLGFAVEEVNLQFTGAGHEQLQLKLVVAARRFHATQLQELTGLTVGEGQARILLADLRAYQGRLQQDAHASISEPFAARRWQDEVLAPLMDEAHRAVGGVGEPIQAYCDLLEVRWLLSGKAGADVGDAAALAALANRSVPPDSAAGMMVADASTGQLPALTVSMLAELDDEPDDE